MKVIHKNKKPGVCGQATHSGDDLHRGTTPVISQRRSPLGAKQLHCLITGQTGDAYCADIAPSAALLRNETYLALRVGSHQPPTL